MANEVPRTRADTAGITIGLIVFFLGVGLLAFVFVLALRVFGDPGLVTAVASQGSNPAGGQGASSPMVGALVRMIHQVVLLFIMLLAGSLVASKGIHLYAAGR